MYSFQTLVFIVQIFNTVSGLRIVVSGPTNSTIGDNVVLQCGYDLEGANLYVVKWYKSHQEIGRYVPDSFPSILLFDHSLGSQTFLQANYTKATLKLNGVNKRSEGNYTCEVSTAAPQFITTYGEFKLVVKDISKYENGSQTMRNSTTPVQEMVNDSNSNQELFESPTNKSKHPYLDVKEASVYFKRTQYIIHA